ncbi:GntR family transcriptional regulator [Nocardia puris]|uniref:GntR family transcriptional regulator n=1 Tax=Nocardia puris TaxID=208602 RepID=UPI0018930552|nr:GntR family transcriptional regulator [Nocardia puris]MBF6463064.1 GntR family transcriptional regulator [Nocardia puris]
MTEPAYVSIAAMYARQIRSGELPGGTQLRSLSELVERHGVSKIVVIQAIQLLERQGLVRTVPRRGTFVTDSPNLVRVAPERQMEDPEDTYGHESDREVRIDRETSLVAATGDLAHEFGVAPDAAVELRHTITRAAEDGRPISISDTYEPVGAPDISHAVVLEEMVSDRIPTPVHAEWLGAAPGDLTKAVRQRYLGENGQLLMLSEISYPRDRYDAFVFRMRLDAGAKPTGSPDHNV